jgi:hypothetical protein
MFVFSEAVCEEQLLNKKALLLSYKKQCFFYCYIVVIPRILTIHLQQQQNRLHLQRSDP